MTKILSRLEALTRRLPTIRPKTTGSAPHSAGETPSDIACFARTTATRATRGGPHCHPRHVLCVCLRGGGGLVIDDRLITMRPGEALLLFPFENHHFHHFESEKILWLFVGFDFGAADFCEPLRARANPLDDGLAHDLELFLETGSKAGPHAGEMLRSARLLTVLAGLASHAAVTPDSTDMKSGHPLVRAVLADMGRRPGGDGGLAGMAGRLHVSESHLRRTFREITDVPLGKFLAANRVRLARLLLARGDMRVGEIATRCGFTGPYAFSRAFRQATGESPREFRRAAREGR